MKLFLKHQGGSFIGLKKTHFHSILLAKTSPSSNGVFFVSYYWLKHKAPEGSDAYYTANNAAHKTSLLKPFYILLDQKKNNEHKSNEIRDLEADMFPKIHCGLSRTQKAQEHNNCSDKPVFHTLFKGSLFFSLCDYLFICLLIYFSLPRVQRVTILFSSLMFRHPRVLKSCSIFSSESPASHDTSLGTTKSPRWTHPSSFFLINFR